MSYDYGCVFFKCTGIKTGMPVLASYNIPPGAVSDAVKNDIFAACFDLISASHVV